ncbi:RNA polymerase sigma factor [Thalassobacillus hwangdonensis]|uniref:RNA polymerase sigma factor n=1 Tax=Thalassobacillus hwangdonensis TaxID=546108 RepID=A0ABW3KX84_9BACI
MENELLREALDEHYDELLNYLYLQTGSSHDAHDLVQEVYMKVVTAITSFKQESTLRTWLFKIARNVFQDHLRKKYRWKRLIDRLKMHQTTTQSHRKDIENNDIFLWLDSFDQETRQLLTLKYYFEFSYAEISAITGMTVTNIGVKLSRIKQDIKLKEGGMENGTTR